MEEKIRLAVFGQKRLSREGGIEIVVKELCTRMAQNGCDVTCYNRAGHHVSGAEYDKTIEYDGIRQKVVPTIEKKGLAAVSSSFFAALYSAFGRYDVVHIHAEGPAFFCWICLYPQDWQTRSYLALGGVSGKALDRFLSERKDTRKVFLCLDSDTAGGEACFRLAQDIPSEIAVIRLVPARKDWNDVLRQQGDIPSRKFIAETITLRELPTAQPVPMLRMADVELTSVDWLWFPYIPFGKLTIIQGNPGEGKTYFAMRLAAACTNRKPLPGMETLEPFNIIYQTAEDGLGDTVKPRLMEADADLERVLVIDDRDTPLTLADERIARAIRENNARLVIIDPVQAFLGVDVDMNRANEVRPIFRSLGDIAQATGCAIVLIGHLNKAAGTQSTYRGLGSIDITAAVRSLLFIGKLKDIPTTRVLIHEKSSLAPPGQSLAFSLGDEKGFEWIGAYDITADELLAGTDTAKTESKTVQAQMLILELLADGKRMPSAELEKAVNERGISSRTMRTAKSRIGDRLVTEKDGTAWVCYLRD